MRPQPDDSAAWFSANRPSSYPRETESRETVPGDEHGDAEGDE